MIISKLIGGLGNQMFQFAAGHALAKRLNMQHRIDIILLNKYKSHNGYQLNQIFDSNFEIASYFELFGLLKLKTFSVVYESVDKVDPYLFKPKNRIFREYSHNFINEFKNINSECYLSGYWQSTKYFEDVEQDLRKIFSFKNDLKGLNKSYEIEIKNTNSVCVHVRRGDYITNLNAAKFHGICEMDYYNNAIKLISNSIENPTYFIFSDDVEYVKSNFSYLKNYTIVHNNQGSESYNDMRLMGMCKHHIIANSSFSWWGAWLAGWKEQIVIAPKIWFAGSDEPVRDIYKPEWILL